MNSDSSILHIGAQCSLPSCNLCDFLPIACSHCHQTFCSDHISLDSHKCPILETRTITTDESTTESDQIRRCDLDGCRKPSLLFSGGKGETCSACHKAFCALHRHQDVHKCPSLVVGTKAPTKKASSSIASRVKLPPLRNKPPTDPVKLAQWQKMEVMKMQHRASPADPKDKNTSPPPDQRLHVKVAVEETEKVFWFRKTVVTGCALDLLVSRLGLTFPGNPALILSKIPADDKEDPVVLQNDQLLVNEIEDGSLVIVSPASR
ncbi:hypothetical protein CVT25_006426 [Psilocybe cyanescens]|uniref:AN1-type domain-containing protein n=1 Tax=Psilocybe cyanescens TaxID=93625 RepID=A0A409XEA1_PSICY|nr:hypothetical protein CVT25_006426 [Psilocybe cyanescens]